MSSSPFKPKYLRESEMLTSASLVENVLLKRLLMRKELKLSQMEKKVKEQREKLKQSEKKLKDYESLAGLRIFKKCIRVCGELVALCKSSVSGLGIEVEESEEYKLVTRIAKHLGEEYSEESDSIMGTNEKVDYGLIFIIFFLKKNISV